MSRIAVLDDQETNVRLLEEILRRAGYLDVVTTTDSASALDQWCAQRPDLILLDLHMPPPDGFKLLEQVRTSELANQFVPILVLTADGTSDAKERALDLGAKDFLIKPFDRVEVLLRIRNLLETRELYVLQRTWIEDLETRVRERTRALQDAQFEMLERLATAADLRDGETGEHARRVGQSTEILAAALGLNEGECEAYRWAAPLHDVGKIGVPDAILLKPGGLTPGEFERVMTHTVMGAELLSRSGLPVLRLAEEMALWHHERWDGRGYHGLAGCDIPLSARIVSVTDVFDALVHERPYKAAWEVDRALAEIRDQSGAMFDPRVAAAFLDLFQAGKLQGLESPTRTGQTRSVNPPARGQMEAAQALP